VTPDFDGNAATVAILKTQTRDQTGLLPGNRDVIDQLAQGMLGGLAFF
jgi:hypothetical protein